ncbi:DUF4248 domain-containing protein [Bacteroides sp.]
MSEQEREHKKILRMLNGCINTFELIRLYFPNYSDPRSARNAFRRTIEETPGMAEELSANGFKESNQMQTPKINIIFVRYWDLSDAVLQLLNHKEEVA